MKKKKTGKKETQISRPSFCSITEMVKFSTTHHLPSSGWRNQEMKWKSSTLSRLLAKGFEAIFAKFFSTLFDRLIALIRKIGCRRAGKKKNIFVHKKIYFFRLSRTFSMAESHEWRDILYFFLPSTSISFARARLFQSFMEILGNSRGWSGKFHTISSCSDTFALPLTLHTLGRTVTQKKKCGALSRSSTETFQGSGRARARAKRENRTNLLLISVRFRLRIP